MCSLGLAETEVWPLEKRLQFGLPLWGRVSNFDTYTDTDTYSTSWSSATEQPATINTSTAIVEQKSTSPGRSVSNLDTDTCSTTQASCAVQQLMSTFIQNGIAINTCTLFVERKLTLPQRSVATFDVPCMYISTTVQQVVSNCVYTGHDDHLLCLPSGSPHPHGVVWRISTPTVQPMIWTKRLRTTINDAQAGCSSIFVTFLPCDTYNINSAHRTTGLCITFSGVVELKSRQSKAKAQLTTELRYRHILDASNGMSGRMVICKELRAWHSLASVFCVFSVCFFNGLVFDGCDNALEQWWTE